jgi:hypothetical protein
MYLRQPGHSPTDLRHRALSELTSAPEGAGMTPSTCITSVGQIRPSAVPST